MAISQSDLNGIRSAAQWLLAAFGATALVVVAGIGIADAGSVLAQGTWRTWLTLLGMALVGIGLSLLASAAARVLVSDRMHLTDLLTEQVRHDAASKGIVISSSAQRKGRRSWSLHNDDPDKVSKHTLQEINRARGWLLPDNCENLDEAYQCFVKSRGERRAALRSRFGEIVAFARTEAALYRYRKLVQRLVGWHGLIVVMGIVILVVACHSTEAPPAPVTEPFPVQVHFVSDAASLAQHGVNPACASSTASGVAVGGWFDQPEIVLIGTSSCPSTKITMSEEIGLSVPVIK